MDPRKMPPERYALYARVYREHYFAVIEVTNDLRQLGGDAPAQRLRDALSICVASRPPEDGESDQVQAAFEAAAVTYRKYEAEIKNWQEVIRHVGNMRKWLAQQKIDTPIINQLRGSLEEALKMVQADKPQEALSFLEASAALIPATEQQARHAKAERKDPQPPVAKKPAIPQPSSLQTEIRPGTQSSVAAVASMLKKRGVHLDLNPGNPEEQQHEKRQIKPKVEEKPIAEQKAPAQPAFRVEITPRIPPAKQGAKKGAKKEKDSATSIFLKFPNKEAGQAFLEHLLKNTKLSKAEVENYCRFTDTTNTTLQLKATYNMEEKMLERDLDKRWGRPEISHQWNLQFPDPLIIDNWKEFIGQETLSRPDGSTFGKDFPPPPKEETEAAPRPYFQ